MASTQLAESMHLLNTKMISGLHIGIYSKTLIFILLFLSLFSLSLTKIFASIKINEFYSGGTSSSNPDWVEIYLDGDTITLYKLEDLASNSKDFTEATCSGNYCTVDWSNRLNIDSDTIKLILISSS